LSTFGTVASKGVIIMDNDLKLDFANYNYRMPWMEDIEACSLVEQYEDGEWNTLEGLGKKNRYNQNLIQRWLKMPVMRRPEKADILASGGRLRCYLTEERSNDVVFATGMIDGFVKLEGAGFCSVKSVAIVDVPRWKPNRGEGAFFVGSAGEVLVCGKHELIEEMWAVGNCFQTSEKAKMASEYLYGKGAE